MTDRFEREKHFDMIYKKYESAVYNTARFMLRDHDAACDIVQEVFYHFNERMDSVSDTGVKAYLITAAQHSALNYIRDAKREMLSDNIEEEVAKVAVPVESAEEVYFGNEQRKIDIKIGAEMFRELREKNENWYEIMYLAYAKHMSYDQIAKKLGLSKEVLYCRLYRAKEWMQKKYGTTFEDIEAIITKKVSI